ncbi:MAG: 4Fe-4S binding protein [Candidatus Hydrothermarchaeota archaeon]
MNVNRRKCCYCGACVGVCPYLALELVETFVVVDEEDCKECAICEKICPVGAISLG